MAPLEESHSGRPREARWSPDPDTDDAANPLGQVPVVRFVNRPQLDGSGVGEFEDVIDVQDRINNAVLDRLVITKMQAYRQRWAKGIDTEDEDGNPLDVPFVPGVDLLWAVANPDVEFGDFTEADIRQVLAAVRDDIQDLSAVSRTPPHYLLGQMTNISGEALTAAEAGLVSKARNRIATFGESWAQVMRLTFAYRGQDAPDMETLWADPQQHSEVELADAAVKKQQAGVTWRQRMRDLQYSPQTIDRMESERMQDALQAAVAAPLVEQPPARTEQQPTATGA
ncbi:MAG: phage portal protein [Nocardioidaceae bacterium]